MINILGIFSIIVFYLLILGVGMWAASKKGGDDLDQEEEVMLAGRNIGMFVGKSQLLKWSCRNTY